METSSSGCNVLSSQDSSATIGKGCRIGPNVVIGPGVVVEDGKRNFDSRNFETHALSHG